MRNSFKLLPPLAAFLLGSCPLLASNIVLTGHDDDFHQSTNALGQISAFAHYAANGSTLPFLVFDASNELTSGLTAAGVTNFVNVDPSVASNVTDALFDPTKYSAFMIASDESCGGCDNNTVTSANINAHASAIASFLNAGGGIVAFAGGDNANYYAFLPQTASSVGGAPSDGYSQTSVGATLGIPDVNGDATHNLFYTPGTGGTSSAYQVAEINAFGNGTILGPDAATTLVCTDCTTSGGVIVSGGGGTSDTPEPTSVLLLTCGLGGLGFYVRRRHLAEA